jgi:hypothetical protein
VGVSTLVMWSMELACPIITVSHVCTIYINWRYTVLGHEASPHQRDCLRAVILMPDVLQVTSCVGFQVLTAVTMKNVFFKLPTLK